MRIASLSPSITEILFKLGVEDQIVCTDQFSDYPEEAKDILHLRDHQNISLEDLREQHTELIITSTVIQENLKQKLDLLRQGYGGQEADDMSVLHFDPRTLNQTYECIRNLGVMLQCEKKATELIRSMQEGFNDVKKKAKLLPKKLKLYIEEWPASAPNGATAGRPAFASGNWVPEVARLAGGNPFDYAQGRPFPRTTGELSPEVTLEQVQAWKPDLVVLSWCGAGVAVDAKAIFLQRIGWEEIVPEDKIFVIDDSLLNRHGPRLVEGCQRIYSWIFEYLH